MKLKELSGYLRGGQAVHLLNDDGGTISTSRPEGKDYTGFMLPFTDVADAEVTEIGALGSAIYVRIDAECQSARVLANRVSRESAPLWFYNEVNGANCRYTREQLAELRHKTNMYGNK